MREKIQLQRIGTAFQIKTRHPKHNIFEWPVTSIRFSMQQIITECK